jgi:peptidoglycan/xylan/chitin deacetylase (PgdA/CDA1 family)
VAYWNVDPRDWSQPGVDKIVSGVLTATRPGSIVLLHELHRQTLDALPQVLDGVQASGMVPTSISGLVGSPYVYRAG